MSEFSRTPSTVVRSPIFTGIATPETGDTGAGGTGAVSPARAPAGQVNKARTAAAKILIGT